jgi:hypothetical protein
MSDLPGGKGGGPSPFVNGFGKTPQSIHIPLISATGVSYVTSTFDQPIDGWRFADR